MNGDKTITTEKKKLFDPECLILAKHFLGIGAYTLVYDDLALHIQEAAEDWLSSHEGG